MFENNNIYSNNFNSYEEGSDVEPRVPVPVGVGIMIARRQRQHDPRQPDLGQLAARHDAVPRADALSGSSGIELRSRTATASTTTSWGARRTATGSRTAWTSGGTTPPQQQNNCWFDNGNVTHVAARADPAVEAARTRARASPTARRRPSCSPARRAIETDSYDANACAWFRPPPRPSGSAQPSRRVDAAADGAVPRLGRRLTGPAVRTSACVSGPRSAARRSATGCEGSIRRRRLRRRPRGGVRRRRPAGAGRRAGGRSARAGRAAADGDLPGVAGGPGAPAQEHGGPARGGCGRAAEGGRDAGGRRGLRDPRRRAASPSSPAASCSTTSTTAPRDSGRWRRRSRRSTR